MPVLVHPITDSVAMLAEQTDAELIRFAALPERDIRERFDALAVIVNRRVTATPCTGYYLGCCCAACIAEEQAVDRLR